MIIAKNICPSVAIIHVDEVCACGVIVQCAQLRFVYISYHLL